MVEAIERMVSLRHMVADDLARTQVLLSQLGYIGTLKNSVTDTTRSYVRGTTRL
jgi:hypothetical protein